MTVAPGFILQSEAAVAMFAKENGLTVKDCKKRLREDAAAKRAYPIGDCDNWDEEKCCCKGHEE